MPCPRGLLLIIVASAGCLGASPPVPTGVPDATDLSSLAIGGILLEDCSGARLSLARPDPGRNDHVPPAFKPSADLPLSAGLGVDALTCQRAVVFNETRPPLSLLWAWAEVRPVNGSMAEPGAFSLFTYEVWTSDDFLGLALQRWGAAPRVASVDSDSRLLPGGASLERRVFENGATSFIVEWVRGPDDVAPNRAQGEIPRHQWFSLPDAYVRLDALERDAYGPDDAHAPATVEVVGPSDFGRLLGGSPSPARGIALPEVSWEISGEAKTFWKVE